MGGRSLGVGVRRCLAGLCVATAVGAQEIKRGGTMVVALPGDPEVLNSSITTDIASSNLCGQVYSTLVRLDNDGAVQPYLAKSWEISPDGLTYTFHLFDNVKWHDGKPFTAEDVAWGLWNVNQKYNGPASGLLEPVESIDATDKLTVVFKLKFPYPPLLRGLAYFNSSNILPKHIFDNGEDPRRNAANFKPVGTGPFVFKEYRKGSHLIFERNPNFHLKGQPYLDRLVFQIIPNEAARALALEKGDIDFIPYYATSLVGGRSPEGQSQDHDRDRQAHDRGRVHGVHQHAQCAAQQEGGSPGALSTRSIARSCWRRPVSATARSRPGRSRPSS